MSIYYLSSREQALNSLSTEGFRLELGLSWTCNTIEMEILVEAFSVCLGTVH